MNAILIILRWFRLKAYSNKNTETFTVIFSVHFQCHPLKIFFYTPTPTDLLTYSLEGTLAFYLLLIYITCARTYLCMSYHIVCIIYQVLQYISVTKHKSKVTYVAFNYISAEQKPTCLELLNSWILSLIHRSGQDKTPKFELLFSNFEKFIFHLNRLKIR